MSEAESKLVHELDATEQGVDGTRYRVAPDGTGMIVYEPLDERVGGLATTKFTHTSTTTFEGEVALQDLHNYFPGFGSGQAAQPVQQNYPAYSQIAPIPPHPYDYSQPPQANVAVQEPVTKPYETVRATEPLTILPSSHYGGPRRNALWYLIKQQTAERKAFRKIAIPSTIGAVVITAALFIAPTTGAHSNGYKAGVECTDDGLASLFNLGPCAQEGFIHNYLPNSAKTTGAKKK